MNAKNKTKDDYLLGPGERVDRMRQRLGRALHFRNVAIVIDPPQGVRKDWHLVLTLGRHQRTVIYSHGSGFRAGWVKWGEPGSSYMIDEDAFVARVIRVFENLEASYLTDAAEGPELNKPKPEASVHAFTTDELEAELGRRNAGYAMKQLPHSVSALNSLINLWNDRDNDALLDVLDLKKQIREAAVTIRKHAKLVFDVVDSEGQLKPLTKKVRT